MKNAAARSTVLAAILFVLSATAFADQAAPIARIVVTAKRMSDADKAREAAQERQREAALAAQPANPKNGARNGKVS